VSATVDNVALHASRRGIAVGAVIAVLAAAVVVVFRDSYATIWDLWKLTTYQYAFIVVPAAAYLLCSQRAVLTAQSIAPSWWALLVLFALAMLWQVSRATATQAVEHATAMLAIPAIVWAVLGRNVLRATAFAWLLLLTAIPVGEALTPSLMVVTADISTGLLQLFGISYIRTGQYISLSGGEFEVADVCSGLRYLLIGVTLALLFSYWNFRTVRARAIFVAITAVVFVIGNGIRAFIVMAVASASGMRYLVGEDHVLFGTILFGVLLGVVLWVAKRYAHKPPERASTEEAAHSPAFRRAPVAVASAAAIGVLLVGPAIEAYRPDAAATVAGIRLPALQGCSAPGEWRAHWTPVIHGESVQQQGSYDCGGLDVHILMVAYPRQSPGSELVNSANRIVPSDWWQKGAQTTVDVEVDERRRHAVRQTVLETATGPMLTWSWYAVDGRPTVSTYGVKLREAWSALTLDAPDSRAYVVSIAGRSQTLDALREQARQAARALEAEL
jgi:EpsI family protein